MFLFLKQTIRIFDMCTIPHRRLPLLCKDGCGEYFSILAFGFLLIKKLSERNLLLVQVLNRVTRFKMPSCTQPELYCLFPIITTFILTQLFLLNRSQRKYFSCNSKQRSLHNRPVLQGAACGDGYTVSARRQTNHLTDHIFLKRMIRGLHHHFQSHSIRTARFIQIELEPDYSGPGTTASATGCSVWRKGVK